MLTFINYFSISVQQLSSENFLAKLPRSVIQAGKIIDIREGLNDVLQVTLINLTQHEILIIKEAFATLLKKIHNKSVVYTIKLFIIIFFTYYLFDFVVSVIFFKNYILFSFRSIPTQIP